MSAASQVNACRPLGVLLGGPFGETEDKSETRAVVVISERLWKTKFQQDLKVIGATLSLDGRPYEIVGVTPPQANEGAGVDVYLPLTQLPYLHDLETNRGGRALGVIGRFKDEVTLSQARTDVEEISKRLSADYPATNTKVVFSLRRLLKNFVSSAKVAAIALVASTTGPLQPATA